MLVAALALLAAGVAAQPAGGQPGAPLVLEIRPAGVPQRTGQPHALKTDVSRPDGDGVDGGVVDLEVTAGPGDDDVGTGGHTPGGAGHVLHDGRRLERPRRPPRRP